MVFSDAVRKYGGEFDLSTVEPTPLREILEHFQGRIASIPRAAGHERGYLDRISTAYARNRRLNAFATVESDRFLVGVTIAAFPLVFGALRTLLSFSDVLKEVGDASQERYRASETGERIRLTLDGDVPLPEAVLLCFKDRSPQDSGRASFATLSAFLACNFLLFHEFGHIGLGHVAYLEAEAGREDLSEFDSQEMSQKEIEVRQALEFDADRFATAALHCGARALRAETDVLPAALLGVGVLFRIMAIQTERFRGVLNACHPHPDLRLTSVWQYFRRFTGHDRPDDEAAVVETAMRITSSLDQTWESLAMPLTRERSIGAHMADVSSGLKDLEKRADRLKGQLEPFLPARESARLAGNCDGAT